MINLLIYVKDTSSATLIIIAMMLIIVSMGLKIREEKRKEQNENT